MDVGILDEMVMDVVNVSFVFSSVVISDGLFVVGSGSSVVMIGEVVDDKDVGVGRVGIGFVGGMNVG